MKVFGLVGWSGSGKTTLAVGLVTWLVQHGYSVSTIKHTHHGVPLDEAGKDTDRHRVAGATDVILTSPRGWRLVHELRNETEPSPMDFFDRLAPVDLLLVEGFKQYPHSKLEVHRPALGKPFLYPNDSSITAVATDVLVDGVPIPCLDLNDISAIGNFIIQKTGLLEQQPQPWVSASPLS